MNHARLIFEDTPAFIPVPHELQHRKTEIIFLSLDDELMPESSATQQNLAGQNAVSEITNPEVFFASMPAIDAENPPVLTDLLGKVPPCFKNATEVDAFIRAERDAWND